MPGRGGKNPGKGTHKARTGGSLAYRLRRIFGEKNVMENVKQLDEKTTLSEFIETMLDGGITATVIEAYTDDIEFKVKIELKDVKRARYSA